MPQSILQIIRFIVLAILQILVIHNIHFFGYGTPFLAILFVLLLPLEVKKWQVLVLSFLFGFCIDFFVGTYGLYAMATTAVGFFRFNILQLVVHKFVYTEDEQTRLSKLSVFEFVKYTFCSALLFCLFFFLVDYFSFSAILRLGLHIITSTISTVLFVFIYRYLFVNINY